MQWVDYNLVYSIALKYGSCWLLLAEGMGDPSGTQTNGPAQGSTGKNRLSPLTWNSRVRARNMSLLRRNIDNKSSLWCDASKQMDRSDWSLSTIRNLSAQALSGWRILPLLNPHGFEIANCSLKETSVPSNRRSWTTCLGLDCCALKRRLVKV